MKTRLRSGLGPFNLPFALALLAAFLAAPSAFAQAAPPTPIASLSTPLIAIAILGLVSAYITQAVNTGSFLGIATIPVKALPFLTLGGTFLGTVVTQLADAESLTGAVIFNAIIMGLFMLLAPVTGATIHQHLSTPARTSASGTAVSGGGTVPGSRGFAKLGLLAALACVGPAILVSALLSGCLSSAPLVPVTPANATQMSQCANTATMHDGIVVGDYVIGGLGATAGAVAAALPAADIGAKNGLAITGAAAAAVVAAGAGLASLTASQFAAQGCSDVVGPLVNKAGPK